MTDKEIEDYVFENSSLEGGEFDEAKEAAIYLVNKQQKIDIEIIDKFFDTVDDYDYLNTLYDDCVDMHKLRIDLKEFIKKNMEE